MDSLGFIVLRHVNNNKTNKYWIHSYNCIRKFYPENIILIIDDNSNYNYVTTKNLYNTIIIRSEYPGRGEVLPYYYYIKYRLFDIAVILHDSVFITKYINFTKYFNNYKMIWSDGNIFNKQSEDKLISVFNDSKLQAFHNNRKLWKGCFGAMTIIAHDFLMHINSKYNISKLLDVIIDRHTRSCFEMIIGCLLQIHGNEEALLGNIFNYYEYDKDNISLCKFKEKCKNLPLIKTFTGR